MRSQANRSERRPLVSSFSILILSGFLIGAASGPFMTGELSHQALTVGVFGILSFFGLDQVKHRRKRRADAVDQLYIEGRLAKHVDHCTSNFDEDSRNVEEIDEVEVSVDELQSAC